jgi:hypothetical protein
MLSALSPNNLGLKNIKKRFYFLLFLLDKSDLIKRYGL